MRKTIPPSSDAAESFPERLSPRTSEACSEDTALVSPLGKTVAEIKPNPLVATVAAPENRRMRLESITPCVVLAASGSAYAQATETEGPRRVRLLTAPVYAVSSENSLLVLRERCTSGEITAHTFETAIPSIKGHNWNEEAQITGDWKILHDDTVISPPERSFMLNAPSTLEESAGFAIFANPGIQR